MLFKVKVILFGTDENEGTRRTEIFFSDSLGDALERAKFLASRTGFELYKISIKNAA